MRQPETIVNTIANMRTNIDEYKSAQPITADSWKLYRYTGTYNKSAGAKGYIIFTLDNPDIPAVVKHDQRLWTYALFPTGIISQNGVHFFVFDDSVSGDIPYGINSTQPGTVTTSSTPPFHCDIP